METKIVTHRLWIPTILYKMIFIILSLFSELPKTSTQDMTLGMCNAVYTVPDFIPIRDKYVKISKQTEEGILSFFYIDEVYNFKMHKQGKTVENKDVDYKEFFDLITQHCGVEFKAIPLIKTK